jgi:hypothetical protein
MIKARDSLTTWRNRLGTEGIEAIAIHMKGQELTTSGEIAHEVRRLLGIDDEADIDAIEWKKGARPFIYATWDEDQGKGKVVSLNL